MPKYKIGDVCIYRATIMPEKVVIAEVEPKQWWHIQQRYLVKANLTNHYIRYREKELMPLENPTMTSKEDELDPSECVYIPMSRNKAESGGWGYVTTDELLIGYIPRSQAHTVEEIEAAIGEDDKATTGGKWIEKMDMDVYKLIVKYRNELRQQIRTKLNINKEK